MLPNLNFHARHLSTFHSLPIILRLHLHTYQPHTCCLAHYARSVTIFAAGLRSTYDSRFRYSCSAYDADTSRFRCLRLFSTASRFRRLIPACIYHPRLSSGFYDFTSIDRMLLRYLLAIAVSACDFAVQQHATLCGFDLRLELQVYRLPSLSILRFSHQWTYRIS
jgi:hypothetical protein